MITMADKPNLHYLNATINVRKLNYMLIFLMQEIQRNANLIPQNVWHQTTRDVTINGYNILKGTAIVPQISVVLIDEKARITEVRAKLLFRSFQIHISSNRSDFWTRVEN
jgi:hypothetical protein